LLASASVDETLAFSDIAAGKVVQRMTLGSPATSMSFHDNGRTCAVGTESGNVLLYDLRNPSEVIASRQMQGRVSAVQFAPSCGESALSKPRRSSADSIEHSASSSVDELGRVVDSVLSRSRESANASTGGLVAKRQKVPANTVSSLDKVGGCRLVRMGQPLMNLIVNSFTPYTLIVLLTIGCCEGDRTRRA